MNDNLEPVVFTDNKNAVEKTFKEIAASPHIQAPPDWFYLAASLYNHRIEDQKQWSKKKMMIVCSQFNDFNIEQANFAQVLVELTKLSSYIKERQNLSFKVMEFVIDSQNSLFTAITQKTGEIKNWYAGIYHQKGGAFEEDDTQTIVNEDCEEYASESPPQKRRKLNE